MIKYQMKNITYSYVLVLAQFMLILILLYINESIFTNTLSMIISLSGFVVGIYAITYNKISNFNIVPEIKKEAQLITHGMYSYIRHPMYFSVLLIMSGVISTQINILNMFIYALLVFVLYLKAKKEEFLWSKRSDEYKKYQKKTKMFIPFLL